MSASPITTRAAEAPTPAAVNRSLTEMDVVNPTLIVPTTAMAVPQAVLGASTQIEPAGVVDALGLFELSMPLAG